MHSIEIYMTHKIPITALIYLCGRFTFCTQNMAKLFETILQTICVRACVRVCGLCLDFCEMCIDTMQFIDFSMTMLTHSICIVSVLILWLLSERASERAMSIYHFPIPVSLIANIRICTHVLSIKCDTYNENYTFNVNHE